MRFLRTYGRVIGLLGRDLRIGQKAGPGAVLRPDQLAGTLPVFQVASLRAAIGLPRW